MRTATTLIVLALTLYVESIIPSSGAIVSPAGSANGEGNSASLVPFNDTSGPSVRYQQVYEPNPFLGLGSDVFRVDEIHFRLNTPLGQPGVFTYLTNIQINLSTTSHGPDGLSPIFADNVGLDDTVVFTSSFATIVGNYDPNSSPQSFGFFFRLTTPFDYDITRGNLLMDIRVYGDRTLSYLDAVNLTGDDVSRLWSSPATSVSGTADTLGLVTQFRVTPIPEPGIGVLFCCGLPFIVWFIRQRAKRGKV